MTRDQIKDIQLNYPEAYEAVVGSLYEWPTSGLIAEIKRWMPQSEFMKLIHQAEKNNEN